MRTRVKNINVYYIALMRDETLPKLPYLIKFGNQQPFYFEIPYLHIFPEQEESILKKEVLRVFVKELGDFVNLKLIRGQVVEETE
jgi:hypothetical protein